MKWQDNLPKNWIVGTLGKLSTLIQYGITATADKDASEGVLLLRISDIDDEGRAHLREPKYVSEKVANVEKYGLVPGDIVIARSGSIGRSFVYQGSDRPWVFASYLIRFRPDQEVVYPDYLGFYLRSSFYWHEVKNVGHTVAQPNINSQELSAISIPLPPLPEQRRIAAVLRQADMLCQWRKNANEKANELQKALFYEMFGNPISNPRGWAKKPFEKICDSHLGKMLDKKQQTGKHIRPYLRNINVQWGYIDLFELVTMDFDEEDRQKFRLKKGDILICEGGEVGRAAIWEDQIEECYFQKALHRARPYEGKATSEYLMYLLWALAENNGFQGIASPMTIPHLTSEKLKALEIPVPPFPLQQEFTRRVQQFMNINENQKSSTEKLINLFSSVAFQAFTGELTASWRERHKAELQRAAVERDKKLGVRGEIPTLKDIEEGRLTPEEEEQIRQVLSQALGQFAVNASKMREAISPLFEMNKNIFEPLIQSLRQSLQATEAVQLPLIPPVNRESFLSYIDNLPVSQEKRAIIESLDTTTLRVLKLAGTYPAYFTADDLETGEFGGITTLQAETSLRTLQALGFVKLVQIDGLLRYRLTDENDYAELPSSLSLQ